MDEAKRIKLIILAIQYCQKAYKQGMPSRCYAKALREPIHFLWETRNGSKYKIAQYRSKSAVGKVCGTGDIVYDHSIPFNYLQVELLNLDDISHQTVKQLLERYSFTCIITREEDRLLTKRGLSRKMPHNWDNKDPLARYKAIGIQIQRNDFV